MLGCTLPAGIVAEVQNVQCTVSLGARVNLPSVVENVALPANYGGISSKSGKTGKLPDHVEMRMKEPQTMAKLYHTGRMVVHHTGTMVTENAARCAARKYEPESAPGRLTYTMAQPKVTVVVRTSGTLTLTGATKCADVHAALRIIYPVLWQYRKGDVAIAPPVGEPDQEVEEVAGSPSGSGYSDQSAATPLQLTPYSDQPAATPVQLVACEAAAADDDELMEVDFVELPPPSPESHLWGWS